MSLKKEKKTLSSKETAKATWSTKIYTITRVLRSIKCKPIYNISAHPGTLYYITQLQKSVPVDPQSIKVFADRPVIDSSLFLREKHLKTRLIKKHIQVVKEKKKEKIEETHIRRSTRARKKSVRYGQ